MREGIRCRQHDIHGSMLQTVANHAGLQAALQQQITDCLISWHESLSQLFVSSPFLTKLDLSKCAAVVSDEDYARLALQQFEDADLLFYDADARQSLAAASAGSNEMHPCALAVLNQQALPISIKALLPMLRRLPCLTSLHLQLTKVTIVPHCCMSHLISAGFASTLTKQLASFWLVC